MIVLITLILKNYTTTIIDLYYYHYHNSENIDNN